MRFPRVGESMNGILPSGRKDVPFRRTARRPNPIKIPRERNTRKRVRKERRKIRLEKTVAVCENWAAESALNQTNIASATKFHETLLYSILLTSLILYIYSNIQVLPKSRHRSNYFLPSVRFFNFDNIFF